MGKMRKVIMDVLDIYELVVVTIRGEGGELGSMTSSQFERGRTALWALMSDWRGLWGNWVVSRRYRRWLASTLRAWQTTRDCLRRVDTSKLGLKPQNPPSRCGIVARPPVQSCSVQTPGIRGNEKQPDEIDGIALLTPPYERHGHERKHSRRCGG